MEQTIPRGLCQCGCGLPTKPARITNRRLGYEKGEPQRFVLGHNHRTKPKLTEAPRCGCGCGALLPLAKYPSQQAYYVHGHNPNGELEPEKIERRFWSFVEKTDGCWLFGGRDKGPLGHSRFHVNGRRRLAHRFSWELANGSIPPGLFVLHDCDNGACVRPDHLYLGTQADNIRDMHARGRAAVNLPRLRKRSAA